VCQDLLVRKSTGALEMDSSGHSELGIELLNQSNYKVWSLISLMKICGMFLMGMIQLLSQTSKEMSMQSKYGSN